MADRFLAGDLVRTVHVDPAHHTRLPRYARGAMGTVQEPVGHYPLADERSKGMSSSPQPVYAVAFAAEELFGAGDHTVMIDIWECKLLPAEPEDRL